MFLKKYYDGDSFNLVLKLCGNMNLLGVNARLWGKPKSFSTLTNFHCIGEIALSYGYLTIPLPNFLVVMAKTLPTHATPWHKL